MPARRDASAAQRADQPLSRSSAPDAVAAWSSAAAASSSGPAPVRGANGVACVVSCWALIKCMTALISARWVNACG